MHVQPEQRYACLQCGKSCRMGWMIPVDPAVEPRIRSLAPERIQYDPNTGLKRLATVQGQCSFLSSEQTCSLHARNAMPLACRHFPFLLVDTPDGLFVGVSFVCTAVQQNHGRPLSEHREAIKELAAAYPIPKIADEILLSGETTLRWPVYLRLEELLGEELDAARALWAAASLAGLEIPGAVPAEALEAAWKKARPDFLKQDEVLVALGTFFAVSLLALRHAPPERSREFTEAVLNDQAVEIAGWKGRFSELTPVNDKEPLQRYLRGLLHRKFLALRRPVLANLVLFFLLEQLYELYAAIGQNPLDMLEVGLVTHNVDPAIDSLLRAFASAYQEQVRAAEAAGK